MDWLTSYVREACYGLLHLLLLEPFIREKQAVTYKGVAYIRRKVYFLYQHCLCKTWSACINGSRLICDFGLTFVLIDIAIVELHKLLCKCRKNLCLRSASSHLVYAANEPRYRLYIEWLCILFKPRSKPLFYTSCGLRYPRVWRINWFNKCTIYTVFLHLR